MPFTQPLFAWHIHHDRLIEVLMQSIKTRRNFIRDYKPEGEVAVRLRLLKPIKGKLPQQLVKAAALYRAAIRSDNKASALACDHLSKSLEKHQKAIEKLHAKECQKCPWNGFTIIPGR